MKRLVLAILALGFALRLFALSSYPVGFTPDEASFAYDAYSILKTARDQWGHVLPLTLESFGDYKSPLYAYLAIPFVKIFGLTKFAVRLPNALLGSAAIFIVYLLVNELFPQKGLRFRIYDLGLSEMTALLLAISPWHIMMSRGAFEANLTTFFLPLALYLFLRGLKKPKVLLWSAVVFGLNLFTYHSAKLVTPIIVIFLIFLFRKELKKIERKKILVSGLVFLVFLALTGYTFSSGAGTRVQDVSIFRGALQAGAEERVVAINSAMPPLLARLFHNKFQVALRRFAGNFLLYLSPQFFFSQGPAEGTYGMMPGKGVLYWFELPFLLGFLLSVFNKLKEKGVVIIAAWLLLAPIPAALATGPGYAANRAAIMMPAIQIALAVGLFNLWGVLKARLKKETLVKVGLSYLAVSLLFFASFLESYFFLSPTKTGKAMLYGNLEVAQWLTANIGKGREVIVSRKLSEPHIYIAFATSWDPKDYQKTTKDWRYKEKGLGWVDQLSEYRLANYAFKNIDWQVDAKSGAVLVGKPEEFPEGTLSLKVFKYPNGEPSVLVVDPLAQYYAKEK